MFQPAKAALCGSLPRTSGQIVHAPNPPGRTPFCPCLMGGRDISHLPDRPFRRSLAELGIAPHPRRHTSTPGDVRQFLSDAEIISKVFRAGATLTSRSSLLSIFGKARHRHPGRWPLLESLPWRAAGSPPQNPSFRMAARMVSALLRRPASSAGFMGVGRGGSTPLRFTTHGTERHTSLIPR